MTDKEKYKNIVTKMMDDRRMALYFDDSAFSGRQRADIATEYAVLGKVLRSIDSVPEKPANKDLEEAAMNYTVEIKGFPGIADETDKKVLKAFKTGWQAGQEQMMKDAIDGLVICDEKLTHGYRDIVFKFPEELKVGDKVKLLIIKEDEV